VDGEVLQRQAAYWERTLAGAPEVLELPTDRPRPARQDHAGASVGVELDEELTAGLKALGRRHGATLFMTLLAGWAAVLGRLAGVEDVVVGAPSANRGRSEIEGLIGFFVNTLALRVDLSGAPTVAELLGRVRARVLEGQQHQDLPFEQVVERVRPARSVAHTPVFQAVFAWQYARTDRLELPGLRVIPPGPPPFVAAKFDLALSLVEVGGRVAGSVTYATALYDRATAERFAGYLRCVLEAMAADDGRIVPRLPLLPDAERRRVLEEWNAPASPVPADACVHELFEARAARTPDAVAVVFGEQRLSYAELNARANRLAHRLGEHGVGPDARVAVCLERGVEMLVGALAVLKAGGAYVPLDPAHPAERLRYVLEDCAPRAVLAGGALRERFAGVGLPVLDPSAPGLESRPATNPDRRCAGLGPDHLAYVIYTSGSTGRPKGVMNSHRAVVNLLTWAQDTWALRPEEAVLQRMPFSFDVSVRELFWPLAVGARVVVVRAEGANDPASLVATIRAEGIGTLHSVPTLLRALLEHPEAESCRSLERVMCGGEVLTPALVRRFHEVLPHASLYQMYGPTETTVAVTVRRCPPGEGEGRVPLGRPVPNTRIYVLDGEGEPVPAGVAGELHVGGAQTARGYVNDPGLTAERFVADPFSPEPGARMYRTGDGGRWRPDGTLEFLGRDDGQVKVRGYRIELGEIEARLRELPGVAEAAVLASEDAPGEARLLAYFAGAAELDAEALRAHLAARLPAYMVPAAYVRLEALPLTPNGKTDRKALPAPDGSAFPGRAYEAPEGETEEALAAIWSELLGVERVGRTDHFFRLGGHSLLATRLVLRIEREMEVPIVLADVFEMPVLAALGEHLRRAQLAQFDPEELERLARLASETAG
jgi:amino acid adenylation domain-containing protein